MTVESRLTSGGIQYVNGSFDEVTYNGSTAFGSRLSNTGIQYATGAFDEVTYNPTSPVIKNLANYSQDGTKWGTGLNTTIISTTEIAPDGTATAVRVRVTANYGGVKTFNQAWPPAVPVTGSAWVRVDSGTQSMQFGLNGGGLGVNFTATPTWTRFSTGPYTHPVAYYDQFYVFNINGSGYTDFIVWGFQVELGSTLTMYQGTTSPGSIVTPNFSNRVGPDGTDYITNLFDEVTWNPPIVTTGAVANLDSYNPNSYPGTGTTWTDLTANQLQATMNSGSAGSPFPLWTLSQQAFYTNATLGNGSFNINANSVLDSTSVTIEIWSQQVNYNTGNNYNNILSYRESYPTTGYRLGVTGSGYPVFWTAQTGGNFTLQSSIATSLNTWYQTVVTYDLASATCKMYINGVLAGTQTSAVYNPPTGRYLSLLAISDGICSANGYYSVFRQYNRALLASEIVQNYNAVCGRYGLAGI